jgi:hypothetical protein
MNLEEMNMKTKKLLAWLLTLVMLVGLLPAAALPALADETTYRHIQVNGHRQ